HMMQRSWHRPTMSSLTRRKRRSRMTGIGAVPFTSNGSASQLKLRDVLRLRTYRRRRPSLELEQHERRRAGSDGGDLQLEVLREARVVLEPDLDLAEELVRVGPLPHVHEVGQALEIASLAALADRGLDRVRVAATEGDQVGLHLRRQLGDPAR